MPYEVRDNQPGCDGHAVVNKDTGQTVPGGCHPDKDSAVKHMQALNLNVAQDLEITPAYPDLAAAALGQPAAPLLVTRPDVELAAVGTWQLSTGEATFTAADFEAACGAVDCPSVGNPVLKLGHIDPRFDGEPAVGRVTNMAYDAAAGKLFGDYEGIPAWLDAVLASAYPNRSIEGAWDFTCQQGHTHPFVISAVALLGVAAPGIGVIKSLGDVAALYGITAAAPPRPVAARPFTLKPQGDTVVNAIALAAGVTAEDVRRKFYEGASWSQWITEIQLDPPQLITADDASGKTYRVPLTIKAGEVSFGDPVEVAVEYVDVPAKKAAAKVYRDAGAAQAAPPAQVAVVWATAEASRAGLADAEAKAIGSHTTGTSTGTWDGSAMWKNLTGTDAAAHRKACAWQDPQAADDTADSAYKFIHHDVASDGTVGDANMTACSTGIGVLNGGRSGTVIPDADKQGVYNHLAKHLTDGGKEAPEFTGSAAAAAAGGEDEDEETDPMVNPPAEGDAGGQGDGGAAAGGSHGPHTGEHSHPHSAYGQQGGDETHDHMHRHNNDAVHNHVHDPASAAPPAAGNQGGGSDMEFTDTQMAAIRQRLGKNDGEEVTPEEIAAAFQAPTFAASAAAGPGELPQISEGTYLVDGAIIRDWQQRAAAGDAAMHRMRVSERDQVLAAAVRDGKFPQARLEHYERLWTKDPEGTRAHVEALAAGLVPMGGPLGTNGGFDPDLGGDFEGQAAYKELYPEDAAQGVSANG